MRFQNIPVLVLGFCFWHVPAGFLCPSYKLKAQGMPLQGTSVIKEPQSLGFPPRGTIVLRALVLKLDVLDSNPRAMSLFTDV